MAGTDHTAPPSPTEKTGPAIILVRPQLAQNIGMVARAMLNNGLTDLRMVTPRDGWPNPDAVAAAAGATEVLEGARVFETTQEAAADLKRVYATTARDRHMTKPVVTPRQAAGEIHDVEAQGMECGIIFGPEAKGLNNDDVVVADAILNVPLNPTFSSLNLAQAVLLVGYEWFQAAAQTPGRYMTFASDTTLASKKDLDFLFNHLETELVTSGFLFPEEKRPTMVRTLRNLFQRAELTEQEVRTLRGVIVSLVRSGTR